MRKIAGLPPTAAVFVHMALPCQYDRLLFPTSVSPIDFIRVPAHRGFVSGSRGNFGVSSRHIVRALFGRATSTSSISTEELADCRVAVSARFRHELLLIPDAAIR